MQPAIPNSTKPRRSLGQRINFRMIVVVSVVLFLVGFPVYTFLDAAITGGVENAGNRMKKVDLKALGNFPFDDKTSTINDIPQKWRDLDGQKVVLEGFIAPPPSSAAYDLNSFQFVYNVAKCCFNGPPLVQERVFTVVPDGRTIPYDSSMLRCTGTLHVDVQKDEAGTTKAVFIMDLTKVERS
jgi:hypothetical protein